MQPTPSQPSFQVRQRLEQLLGAHRYEEALDLLDAVRWETPDVAGLSRGIRLLKEHLQRRFMQRIGDLDRIPHITITDEDPAWLRVGEDERTLARLMDGIASFADVLRESRFGRFETHRALAHLLEAGIIRSVADPFAEFMR